MIAVNLSRSSPAKRAVRAFRFRISYLIQMNPGQLIKKMPASERLEWNYADQHDMP